MDKKKVILLVTALIIAIGCALAVRSIITGAAAPQANAAPAEPQGPKVLVAKRALPVGTIITADAVGYQLWPKEMVQDAYFIDGEADMTKLLGTVVRFPVTAGEPVTQGSLVAPGDRGFLAAALGPGMRAVTVPVSAKTGVGGFIFPGDRVDLVLTQEVKGAEASDSMNAAETILRNLRVLATDQSTETTTSEDGKTVVRQFRTVTLEVTPRIAEKIAVAQEIGTLSLTLRSIADNQTQLEQALANGDINIADGVSADEEEQMLRTASAGPQEGSTSFQTGGDVSRFQPRSVSRAPRAAPAPASSGRDFNPADLFRPQAPQHSGPVVRVTRGKATTTVPIGANGSVAAQQSTQPSVFEQLITSAVKAQAQGAGNVAGTVPPASTAAMVN